MHLECDGIVQTDGADSLLDAENSAPCDGECSFSVSPEEDGLRLDIVLTSERTDLSRNSVQNLIEAGMVTVDGDVERSKKRRIHPGQRISITIPKPKILRAEPQDIPIDIIYEDDMVIVVNKRRGMVVHPANGNPDGTLANALMFHCSSGLSTINGEIRPGIVHRIDKDTSGLLMAAKNDFAHEHLADQLRRHSVRREYTALVYDNIREDELTIDLPIGRDVSNRMKRAVNGSASRDAITHVRVLRRYGRYTLISARLETGRTHQIRVHLAHIKHPLVGDTLYGPPVGRQIYGIDGQILHAGKLGFVHPKTCEYMEFNTALPEYFAEVLRKIDS